MLPEDDFYFTFINTEDPDAVIRHFEVIIPTPDDSKSDGDTGACNAGTGSGPNGAMLLATILALLLIRPRRTAMA